MFVPDYPDVTRVEVVGRSGRYFVEYFVRPGVDVAVQDGGRTLKVFVELSEDIA